MLKSRINQITESFRDFVANRNFDETPILTAYVDTDPTNPDNRKERPAWLIELKNEAKRIEAGIDPEKLKRRATQSKWANTEEMVMHHLSDRKPTGRAIVFFTDHTDFIAVDLPVPVATRLYYGLPQIKQLLFNLDQYQKYLVVLLSGSEVRILEVFLARTTDEFRVDTELEMTRHLGRTANAQKRESRSDEFDRRFAKDVASKINEYFLGDPDFERMVLGGNAKQAHAVKSALHPAVRESLVSIEPLDFKLPDSEIAKRVMAIAEKHELENDFAVVDDLIARTNRGGTGVMERQAVEQALERHEVKTLVLPYPIDSDDFDSLIVNATLGGAAIEFVYDGAADRLNEFGGIGAVLYHSGS